MCSGRIGTKVVGQAGIEGCRQPSRPHTAPIVVVGAEVVVDVGRSSNDMPVVAAVHLEEAARGKRPEVSASHASAQMLEARLPCPLVPGLSQLIAGSATEVKSSMRYFESLVHALAKVARRSGYG